MLRQPLAFFCLRGCAGLGRTLLLLCLLLLLLHGPGGLQRLEHRLERCRAGDLHARQVGHGLVRQAHEAAKTRCIDRIKRHTALGQLIKQAASGVLLVAEKLCIAAHQLGNGWLKTLHRLLHWRQQACVLGNVLHHARHHIHRHRLGIGGLGRRSVHRTRHGHALPQPINQPALLAVRQALNQPFQFSHVLQGRRRGRGRNSGIGQPAWIGCPRPDRTHTSRRQGHGTAVGTAQHRFIRVANTTQHLAQDAHRQQGLLGLFCQWYRCTPARLLPISTVLADPGTRRHGERIGSAPLTCTRAATHATHRRHAIAHRGNAMLAQVFGCTLVHRHQLLAQQLAHVLHPGLAHRRRHTRFSHHPLQGADVVFWPQGVALGLHTPQPLGGTDQTVEFSQHGIGGMQRLLLCARQLYLGLHLGIVHQRQLAKVHARRIGGAGFGRLWPFGKDFEQGHGIGLDHGRLMRVQQAQCVAGQITLANVARARLLGGEGAVRDLQQLCHERLALAHGVDDAGPENRSGAGLRL